MPAFTQAYLNKTAKVTGMAFSLFDVASAQQVPFDIECIHDGLTHNQGVRVVRTNPPPGLPILKISFKLVYKAWTPER